jgi:ankyrin repeat protein
VDTNFEAAVDALVYGDLATLAALLQASPELLRARSARPHHATLLHYVAANGVEDERQKSPANAVEIARLLLSAGAEVDALAEMYGAPQTTMNMLVSSAHPARAGVQNALVETLLDFGAAIEGLRQASRECERAVTDAGAPVILNPSPLLTALAHGYLAAAETLARRGAKTDNLPAAAGLGRLSETTHWLKNSTAADRHRALALAAQHGHVDIVRLLLDAGEDPNRFNPPGFHPHSTPLHQAACYGHEAVVRLLVERQARRDIEDTVYHGTPLGWAKHAGNAAIEAYLVRCEHS